VAESRGGREALAKSGLGRRGARRRLRAVALI
jgi:hypothetical protein